MVEKKKISKQSSKKDKEKVCEIFEVESRKGNKKIVKSCGEIDEKKSNEKEIKEQNKILKRVLIGIGLFIVFFIALFLWIDSVRHFNYRGVEFEIVKEGKLILYKTTLPVYYQGGIRDYNFYLRKDPRKIDESVQFNGEIRLLKNLVVNSSDFKCDGDEIIALANLVKLYDVLGSKVIKDPNATCDKLGRYAYITIKDGNETKITEKSIACYDIEVSNCEILEAIERYMTETFVEVNKIKASLSS